MKCEKSTSFSQSFALDLGSLYCSCLVSSAYFGNQGCPSSALLFAFVSSADSGPPAPILPSRPSKLEICNACAISSATYRSEVRMARGSVSRTRRLYVSAAVVPDAKHWRKSPRRPGSVALPRHRWSASPRGGAAATAWAPKIPRPSPLLSTVRQLATNWGHLPSARSESGAGFLRVLPGDLFRDHAA